MFRRRSIFGFLGVLLLVLALVAGGIGLYRIGYTHGVVASAAVEGGIERPLRDGFMYPRLWAYGFMPFGFHRGPSLLGMFFGLLFFGGFMLLLAGLIARLFFFRKWAHGPGGHGPYPDWKKPRRGPGGTWVWQSDEPEEAPGTGDAPEPPGEGA